MTGNAPFNVVVLISGRGSNLRSLVEQERAQQLSGARICAVISNRPHAAGIEYANGFGIPTQTIDHSLYTDRTTFEAELIQSIDLHKPNLVVLAGFMRVLTESFVRHYADRLLNIHPSLLPAYRGLKTHERALEAKEQWHGASVHYVTAELDGGPVAIQARVPVRENDSPTTLAARVLTAEHIILPQAVSLIASKRLLSSDNQLFLDGIKMESPIVITMNNS